MSANPLLESHELPPFSAVKAEHVVPAVKTLTEDNLKILADRLSNLGEPTWANLVAPLEADGDKLSQAWAPVGHLNLVCNTAELREAHEQALALLSPYYTALGQNRTLCEAYQTLKDSPQFSTLSQAQQTAIEHALRDFKLSGIDLPEDKQTRYGDIQAELSQLTSKFSNNVLDATQGWHYHTENADNLSGLPESIQAAAKAAAEQKEKSGYVLTLDGPVYMAVMTYADNRELRHTMYEAYNTRASDQGPNAGKWDNATLMENILTLRQELAQLLGFKHYAELSLATKMAQSPEQVVTFLEDMASKAKPAAQHDLDELKAWVQKEFNVSELQHWDITYYSEKLRQAKYSVSSEEIRQYFTLPKVLSGLFSVANKLYGIDVNEAHDKDLWHNDARYFEIAKDGKKIAAFYLDLFAREGKRGGAWMSTYRPSTNYDDADEVRPIITNNLNLITPAGDGPTLMRFDEVETFFHEFGHGLHGLLTQIKYSNFSGVDGPRDYTEFPAQILEHWAGAPEMLAEYALHYETGEAIPLELITKMREASNHNQGFRTTEFIAASLLDLAWHNLSHDEAMAITDARAFEQEVLEGYGLIEEIEPRYRSQYFSHIFAGGYSSGYYAYLWSEILDADGFTAFREAGDIWDPELAARLKQWVYESGGLLPADELYRNFRGSDPTIEPLLRIRGFETNEEGEG